MKRTGIPDGDDAAEFDAVLPKECTGYVRVYTRADGTHDYRIRARNGRIVGPGQGYPVRQHAVDGLDTLREVLRNPLIDAGD